MNNSTNNKFEPWMIVVMVISVVLLVAAGAMGTGLVVHYAGHTNDTEASDSKDDESINENTTAEPTKENAASVDTSDKRSDEAILSEQTDEELEATDSAIEEDASNEEVIPRSPRVSGKLAKVIGQTNTMKETDDYEEEMYEEEESDYIIPDSDKKKLDEHDICNLSPDELRIARNEIYARHGRMFKNQELQDYFDSKDWYAGIYEPDEFQDKWLNEYENYNKDFISKYEKEMGYN